MKKIEINLLHLEQQRVSNQFTKGTPVGSVFPRMAKLFVLATIILSGSAALSYQQALTPDSPISKTFTSFSGVLPQFGENPDRVLNGELSDRVNILLLGVGGKGHEGEQLSDTNIVLSVQPKKKKVAFISLPRDLQVPIEGYGWRKINNANAFGEMEQSGSGTERARAVVSKILNIPIHYTVRVDFHAFSEIVDILGGITVTIDKSFTDYSYPTDNYKYQTVSFKQGTETMNGTRALIFVRSRHSAMNNEGSDFARSKRQQKVLSAVKDKFFSADFLLNPKKIADVMNALSDNIQTNITPWQGIRLLAIAKDVREDDMIRLVLDDGPENYLMSSTVDGAYVLQPRDGTFEAIQRAVQTVFDDQPTPSLKDSIRGESPRVVVKNGTTLAGLATHASHTLSAQGFTVINVGNASSNAYERTVLYLTSDGKKEKSAAYLADYLGATLLTSGWDENELSGLSTRADFLVILGKDHAKESVAE